MKYVQIPLTGRIHDVAEIDLQLITKQEAAQILRVSVKTLEREINAGKLPVLRIRASVRLSLPRVLEYAGAAVNPSPAQS